MTDGPQASPEQQPQPGSRDIRAPIIALITAAYEAGPDSGEAPLWPEGQQGGPWTGPELVAAYGFAAALFLNLAWEMNAAQRAGQAVDIAEFIAIRSLMITLSASGDPLAELRKIAADAGYPVQGDPG
jgi:hypothetical protein